MSNLSPAQEAALDNWNQEVQENSEDPMELDFENPRQAKDKDLDADFTRLILASRASNTSRHNVPRGIDPNSIFGREYKYWISQGDTHIAAKNKATDYYRKFTRREVTYDNDEESPILDQVESENVSLEDQIDFQRLFDKVVYNFVDEDIRLFCGLIAMKNLDALLSRGQQKFHALIMRGSDIGTIGDLAQWMGYKVRKRPDGELGTSQMLLTRRAKLRKKLKQIGFGSEI